MKEHVTVSEPRPVVSLGLSAGDLCKDMARDVLPAKPASEVLDNNKIRRKKRRPYSSQKFEDIYEPTGEILGQGATAKVQSFRHRRTRKEYAVKIINKQSCERTKVLKEVEIFHHCRGHKNILEMVEFIEESDRYYLVFEKLYGGTLLENIQRRGFLTESDASRITGELAGALHFLHNKGISHRDLKPENILCESAATLGPIKIIDFDLGSDIRTQEDSPLSTPELMTPVGSAEYMAPEVVDAWVGEASSYDKKCDIWSLGVILYIMLSGSPPFYASCGKDCGWERGDACPDCQSQLFTRIQLGVFDFPDSTWGQISEPAKNLVRNLLVRDPHHRYSASQILDHPWIRDRVPETPLATPNVLGRNRSSQVLEAFSETVSTFHRLMFNSSTRRSEGFFEHHESMSGRGGNSSSGSRGSQSMFFIGDSPEEAAAESRTDEFGNMIEDDSSSSSNDAHEEGSSVPIAIPRPRAPTGPTVKLSPPSSSLALRRRRSRGDSLSQSQ